VSVALLNLIETTLNGLMTGVMYSLVALGFVLIFKASGIFNFAQGVLALFAALTLVGFQTGQVPFAGLIHAIFGVEMLTWGGGFPTVVSIVLTMAVMVGLAFAIEKFVLKHLVNQEPIILFMATIGLAYFLEGFGDLLWGSDVKVLDIGLPSGGSYWWEDFTKTWAAAGTDYYGMYVDLLDVSAAVIAVVLVAVLSVFSQYTATGRALRAVADDHQAALSVGIPLNWMWVVVWSIAGVVALVAGIFWGISGGAASFALAIIALKALPVLILGGFTSVPGVIVGGFIIGIGEKIAELYWGDFLGGSIEEWFAYVLALAILLFRPQGLFGEKIIERV
jgi:branched-chain amino acid transport system permease protein